jgi:drug/metabolite transporter (DMT)-like permease
VNATKWAIGAAAFTGVQVGVTMVLSKMVLLHIAPVPLAMLRYLVGVLVILPLLARRGFPQFGRRDVVPIALLGICQFGLLIALLNYGLQYIAAARAALVLSATPLLTMMVAIVLGQERLTAFKFIGVLACISGVAVALGDSLMQSISEHEWLGAIAVLAAALCGAICSVLYRPYLRRYVALNVGATAMVAAVIALAAWSVADGYFSRPLQFDLRDWGIVIIIGASSGIAYVLMLWALGRMDPSRVMAFWTLSPVTATILGSIFLGEVASARNFIGLAIIAAGLWICSVTDGRMTVFQGTRGR